MAQRYLQKQFFLGTFCVKVPVALICILRTTCLNRIRQLLPVLQHGSEDGSRCSGFIFQICRVKQVCTESGIRKGIKSSQQK